MPPPREATASHPVARDCSGLSWLLLLGQPKVVWTPLKTQVLVKKKKNAELQQNHEPGSTVLEIRMESPVPSPRVED